MNPSGEIEPSFSSDFPPMDCFPTQPTGSPPLLTFEFPDQACPYHQTALGIRVARTYWELSASRDQGTRQFVEAAYPIESFDHPIQIIELGPPYQHDVIALAHLVPYSYRVSNGSTRRNGELKSVDIRNLQVDASSSERYRTVSPDQDRSLSKMDFVILKVPVFAGGVDTIFSTTSLAGDLRRGLIELNIPGRLVGVNLNITLYQNSFIALARGISFQYPD